MKKKFYKASNDAAFKSIFCRKANRDLLKRLIEESLEKEVTIKSLSIPEVLKYNLSLRGKTLDAVVKADDELYLVEMNANYYNGLNIRNFAFACAKYIEETEVGEDYNEMKNIIQLNYTCGMPKNYEDENGKIKQTPLVFKYEVHDRKNNANYVKNMTIYVFNVDKILDSCYNEGKEKYRFIALLNANQRQLSKMSTEDKDMGKFFDELKTLNSDEEWTNFISVEEDAKKVEKTIMNNCKREGLEQGITQGWEQGMTQGSQQTQREIAKNMLDLDIDIEKIIKATGLTKEEIEKLSKEK